MLTQEIVTRPRMWNTVGSASSSPVPGTKTLLPALMTGGMLWLCFFPVACGWLAWVALVPLLTLVRSNARPRTVYLCAWASGLVFFWPVLQWMRVADYRMYFTWASLATYCSLYFPLAIYLIRLLDRRTRLPFIVSVPIVWTSLEFFRSYFMTGFPWYLLAHTQHDYLRIIQMADLTGAWGVSFLVAAVNAFLCENLFGRWGGSARPRIVIQGVVLAIAFGIVWSYGTWRTGQSAFERGPVLALVQGNLPQYLRNNPTTVDSIAAHYIALCDVAARTKPTLIVCPETSVPFQWKEEWPSGLDPETKSLCRDIAGRFRAPVLLGLNSQVCGSDKVSRKYNSAVLVNEHGAAVARYDKIHRVPFGEYVPLRDWFPFMNWLAPYDFDYSVSAGSAATRFALESPAAGNPPLHFGVVICYEDADSDMNRPYAGADGNEPADFLLNISNDGWFEGTSEHEQHLAVSRFRAIECRQPVARAVNMGISGLIDSNGRVLAPRKLRSENVPSGVGPEPAPAAIWEVGPDSQALPSDHWGEFKSVAGVLLATVPLDTRTSFYARSGDWLPWSCCCILGASVVVAVRRRDNSPGRRVVDNDA
jgi:apolipoprotein N-acyltransferase